MYIEGNQLTDMDNDSSKHETRNDRAEVTDRDKTGDVSDPRPKKMNQSFHMCAQEVTSHLW
jgi:hypothetical protein